MKDFGIEYSRIGTAQFYELGDPPAPGPTEILVATEYSGITNGTERHALMAEHGWTGGGRHGYQHVGRIVRTGSAVTTHAVGDRVFLGPYVGHRGWLTVDVGVASHLEYKNPLVIKIPDTLDPESCALMGVAGVALRGVRRFRVQPAQRVWVAGQGLIGHFAAQSARALGAHVTVSDVDPRRLELALQCGAHRALNAREPAFFSQLLEDGQFDCVIDACGIPSFMNDLLEHRPLAYRGVIGLLAVRTDTTFLWGLLHQTEASIEVSCHFSYDDLRVLRHFMEHGVINIAPVITHRVPVDQALEIYEIMRDDPSSLMGVVFNWMD